MFSGRGVQPVIEPDLARLVVFLARLKDVPLVESRFIGNAVASGIVGHLLG